MKLNSYINKYVNKKRMKEDLDRYCVNMINHKNIKMTGCRYKGNIYIHSIIKSTKKDGVSYDSILILNKGIVDTGGITNRDFTYISNSPEFQFGYAYNYIMENIIIKELTNKLPIEILQKPTSRNLRFNKVLYLIHYVLNNHSKMLKLVDLDKNPMEALKNSFRHYSEIHMDYSNSENIDVESHNDSFKHVRTDLKNTNIISKRNMVSKMGDNLSKSIGKITTVNKTKSNRNRVSKISKRK